MNITQEGEELEKIYDERDYKIKPAFIIGKDIDFVGSPERTGEGFTYKFKAISPKAIKYFSKKAK